MKKLSIFILILLYSCEEKGRVENGSTAYENMPGIVQEENTSNMNDSRLIPGVTTWRSSIEGRNLWNSLRGIFYHEKLDPNYARIATEDLNNFVELEGNKILRCFADIDFSGIRVLSDSIKIDYSQYYEWNTILFSSTVLENRVISFNNLNNTFIITEYFRNSSIITYEIIVVDRDIFLIRIRLDGINQVLTGFVSSPEIDQNGFHRFYRWSGPTEIYKEWPDGTFDPRKAYVEFVKSREGQ